jgi:PAS domain-containing protein
LAHRNDGLTELSLRRAEMPASPLNGSIRFKRLRLAIAVFGGLALLLFASSSAYDIWRSYRHTLTATDRELSNLASALAEQTAWTWQTVYLLLDDTARWYEHRGSEIPPEDVDAVLERRTTAVRQVSLVTILDAQGIQRYRSHGLPPANLDDSDRSYFIAQRDRTTTGFFMSEPLISRSDSHAAVIVSRRLEENGKFAGVITAIVDLDVLKQFYAAVNVSMGSAIQLLRQDGTLLVRNPPSPEAVAHKYPVLARVPDSPATLVVCPIDARREFIAIAPVRDTPLLIAVTRVESMALQPWSDEAIRVALRTGILILLGGFTIVALLRQLRRVEVGERALRQSEERYALALEGANEGHWDWDMINDRVFLSPKMKALTGLPEDAVIDSRSEWMSRMVIHPEDRQARDTALQNHF